MNQSRLLMRIDVDLQLAHDVGAVPAGYRRIMPIVGGSFIGPKLHGEVMPIGADWNLVRADGVMTMSALYLLKTHDGVFITIHNEGMIRGDDGQMEEMTSGQDTDMSKLYTRMRTCLEAPEGRYEWLNKSLWVGQMFPPDSMTRVSMEIFENV